MTLAKQVIQKRSSPLGGLVCESSAPLFPHEKSPEVVFCGAECVTSAAWPTSPGRTQASRWVPDRSFPARFRSNLPGTVLRPTPLVCSRRQVRADSNAAFTCICESNFLRNC